MLKKQKQSFHNILYAITACEDELIYLNPPQNFLFYRRGAAEAEARSGCGR